MRAGLVVVIVIGIATAVWVAASQSAGPIVLPEAAGAGSTEPTTGAPAGPVVVELFTSQGCSSCPPADKLLAEVSSDPRYAGRVIGLSFHVDYWNRIGWEDPFSSQAWTERQHAYARALNVRNVYTPQAVVNGDRQFVGSDSSEMRKAIDAAQSPLAAVSVSTVVEGSKVRASLIVDLDEKADAAEYVVVAVLAQREITTEVMRGENSGRKLVNDHVVRRLETPMRLLGKHAGQSEGKVTFEVDRSWGAGALEVIAFVQDPMSMKIVGAAVSRP